MKLLTINNTSNNTVLLREAYAPVRQKQYWVRPFSSPDPSLFIRYKRLWVSLEVEKRMHFGMTIFGIHGKSRTAR